MSGTFSWQGSTLSGPGLPPPDMVSIIGEFDAKGVQVVVRPQL